MKSKHAYIERTEKEIARDKYEYDYSYYANKSLKLAGTVLEFKEFDKYFPLLNKKKSSRNSDNPKEKKKYTDEEIHEKVYRRAKQKIRDYINSNDGFWTDLNNRPYLSVFVTLTFRENLTDLTIANEEFTDFVRRFSFAYFSSSTNQLKYLAVPEFQKRGAIHYHCIFFNLPFREDAKLILDHCWQFGFSKIKALSRVRNVGKYISKYLSKDFVKLGHRGKKCYFASNKLNQPLKTNFDEIVYRIMAIVPQSSIECEPTDLPTEFLGNMSYSRYNLRDFPDVISKIKELFDYQNNLSESKELLKIKFNPLPKI